MDQKYKNKVMKELNFLNTQIIEMSVNLKPHYPEQLTRECLAATADVLQALYDIRVDLNVKAFEFQNGPTQGEA
jgi:hypothetical protein